MISGNRIILAVAGWAVPGLGHIFRGERVKGILFGATLLGCFIAGQIMSDFRAVSQREHEFAFWAQIGVGLPALGCNFFDRHRHDSDDSFLNIGESPLPEPVPRLLDCGIMYTCVAGLLSFVLVVDLLFPLIEKEKKGEDHD
jgi:hypothetical protein